MNTSTVLAVAQVIEAATASKFPVQTVVNVIQVLTSVFLIAAILLQTPKATSGLGGTIGGGSDAGGGYRTKRGLEKTLFQVTIGLTVIFVLVSLVNIKLG